MTSLLTGDSRASGILAHLSSLPGAFGIGTMGRDAKAFIDLLHDGGQKYWQVLPLGPTAPAFGHSPYSALSAFGGNPLFLDPETVQANPWCPDLKLETLAVPQTGHADFTAADRVKKAFKNAFNGFLQQATPREQADFSEYRRKQADWLDDYALFAVLSRHFHTGHWPSWPDALRLREADALGQARREHAHEVEFEAFLQFLFEGQWQRLKYHAHEKGIRIIGDIPIYVNMDSADTWANPGVFDLDPLTCTPNHIAGVPPDYFSPTGQLWGNPLYHWHESSGLSAKVVNWWIRRLQNARRWFDLIRLDHFRGFSTFWSVPAAAATAEAGNWQKGPGIALFRQMENRLGSLPLIAEDLGDITPDVKELRETLAVPGMKVLQFAFDGDPENIHLPHNYASPNCVVYTGTHDNNTLNGWFYGPENNESSRKYIRDYVTAHEPHNMHLPLIRLALQSVAALAIIPVQDLLGYGAECRMNVPGRGEGNWCWRLQPGHLTPAIMADFSHSCSLYGRA